MNRVTKIELLNDYLCTLPESILFNSLMLDQYVIKPICLLNQLLILIIRYLLSNDDSALVSQLKPDGFKVLLANKYM